jgi:hypothetical protein
MIGPADVHVPSYERELGDHNARIKALEQGHIRIENKIDESTALLGGQMERNTRWLVRTALSALGLILAMIGLFLKGR